MAVVGAFVFSTAPVFAEGGVGPWWHLTSGSRPANLPPGGEGEIVATVTNLGDAPASGCVEAPGAGKYKDHLCSEVASAPEKGSFELSPVRITDTLPHGLKATSVVAIAQVNGGAGSIPCSLESQSRVSCTSVGSPEELEGLVGGLPPYYAIEVRIGVEVEPAAVSGELNQVSVSGGEAPSATAGRPIRVSGEPTRFGVEDYELTPEEPGALDTQAGSHPFQATFTTVLNQEADTQVGVVGSRPAVFPAGLTKDLRFKLPPGLVGNPTVFPQCPIAQFHQHLQGRDACSAETAMGVATVYAYTQEFAYFRFVVPLFNLEPQVGEPARFGFFVPLAGVFVVIDTGVRTGGDYGVTSTTSNITEAASFLAAQVTLWGVPGDPRHNASRGWNCLNDNSGFSSEGGPCVAPEALHPHPFLDLPTECSGPMQSSVEADSWTEEGSFHSTPSVPLPALDGCNRLPFVPQIKVTPDGQQASRPTGLTVDVHVPQEGQLNATGLAQSTVKEIEVTLPEGVTLNPSAGDGLQACSEAQIGYLPGESHPPGELHFTPKLPGSFGSSELLQPGVNFCPDAAKIATVKVKTPLLPNPLEGAVYLASPQNFAVFPPENPFETHVAMYVVAEDPVSGSLVKLPGKVELGGQPGVEGLAPGQIRSTFEDSPQLPFEDAELHFFGGERAPLASPSRCGTYTTNATYTPWSGGEPVHSSSSFQVTSGPNGTPCPGAALPFDPSLASGTTNINAGAFSELTTTLSREDGQQPIQSVTLHYPAGVSGLLTGVKLCPEAQANEGTCGAESQIGETIVSVGVGGDPFTVTGGKVYITGPYKGAPFGLSIVNPAKAGPFDLQEGRPVVVRAKIEVDPHTAALTITTDPPGSPHAIPTVLEGFALQIKHVNVLVNRPGFTFNPTNCAPQSITGAIDSAEGASSPVSVPFQVTNCASLKFAPKFEVSTAAKVSKADGESLSVRLSYPNGGEGFFNGPEGAYTNIARVKVELPKALPSRLTTLQKACASAQFESNPAGCPAASIVGHAKAITPLIPVPLEGPAYFVSHGGEAFPSLVIVLQGYGVTVDLVGTTFINKAGVTSSTFKTIPDAPVGSFELTLPEGPFSALAANGNPCKQKLVMPTEFIAQNGAEIHQSTKIAVTGCGKAKKTKHKRAHKAAKHKRAKKATKHKRRGKK
ncbi:MAG: hypothetical protein ACRDLF_03500 [Solirubrobacteraceae bacterium]